MICQICRRDFPLEETLEAGICNVCGNMCCKDCYRSVDVDDKDVVVCKVCQEKFKATKEEDTDAYMDGREYSEDSEPSDSDPLDAVDFVAEVEEVEYIIESVQSDLDALKDSVKGLNLSLPLLPITDKLAQMELELENLLLAIKCSPEFIVASQEAEHIERIRTEAEEEAAEFYK